MGCFQSKSAASKAKAERLAKAPHFKSSPTYYGEPVKRFEYERSKPAGPKPTYGNPISRREHARTESAEWEAYPGEFLQTGRCTGWKPGSKRPVSRLPAGVVSCRPLGGDGGEGKGTRGEEVVMVVEEMGDVVVEEVSGGEEKVEVVEEVKAGGGDEDGREEEGEESEREWMSIEWRSEEDEDEEEDESSEQEERRWRMLAGRFEVR
ncbi:hypothetical protein PT974_03225 [Cladobotryum mycophilum]|uniref:Uncharacterized protein n=1 Tax=Cladobotryum mycophilum TaxID=491253 RepID=A0ABR0SRP5_9HYPO